VAHIPFDRLHIYVIYGLSRWNVISTLLFSASALPPVVGFYCWSLTVRHFFDTSAFIGTINQPMYRATYSLGTPILSSMGSDGSLKTLSGLSESRLRTSSHPSQINHGSKFYVFLGFCILSCFLGLIWMSLSTVGGCFLPFPHVVIGIFRYMNQTADVMLVYFFISHLVCHYRWVKKLIFSPDTYFLLQLVPNRPLVNSSGRSTDPLLLNKLLDSL